MKNGFLAITVLLATSTCLFVACSKSNNSGSTNLTIRLTDAPFDAQEVNIDIREVRVNFRDDSTGFVPLITKAGIYNLLTLQNGKDTALATGAVETGNLKEVRFILGSNNSIKINKNLNRSFDNLLLDFDADASIYQT